MKFSSNTDDNNDNNNNNNNNNDNDNIYSDDKVCNRFSLDDS